MGASIFNMDCEEKRHYLAVCVYKEKGNEAQSMFFKITFRTALEMLKNLSLLQKLWKAADVNIRQYKCTNIYNYALEKSQEEGSFYKYCCKGYRVA